MSSPFDTFELFKNLREAGVAEEQAQAETLALVRVFNQADVASKKDIAEVKQEIAGLRTEFKHDIADVRQDIDELKQDVSVLKQDVSVLKRDIAELRTEFRHDIAGIRSEMVARELRMTIKMGGMLIATSGIVIGAVAWLFKYFVSGLV